MAIKIYIDQGHNPEGYYNSGASGNGYFEQDVTYEIGILLNSYFAGNPNYETRLSRPTADTVLGSSNSTSLSARVRAANAYGADLFLSLHTNASSNPAANGTECLVYSKSSQPSYDISQNIVEEINRLTGIRIRGVIERPGLYVLKKTNMPAIVVEMAFITNPENAELLVNSPSLFAEAIYRGVVKYYGV